MSKRNAIDAYVVALSNDQYVHAHTIDQDTGEPKKITSTHPWWTSALRFSQPQAEKFAATVPGARAVRVRIVEELGDTDPFPLLLEHLRKLADAAFPREEGKQPFDHPNYRFDARQAISGFVVEKFGPHPGLVDPLLRLEVSCNFGVVSVKYPGELVAALYELVKNKTT